MSFVSVAVKEDGHVALRQQLAKGTCEYYDFYFTE